MGREGKYAIVATVVDRGIECDLITYVIAYRVLRCNRIFIIQIRIST